jgi:hypothetical protein
MCTMASLDVSAHATDFVDEAGIGAFESALCERLFRIEEGDDRDLCF